MKKKKGREREAMAAQRVKVVEPIQISSFVLFSSIPTRWAEK